METKKETQAQLTTLKQKYTNLDNWARYALTNLTKDIENQIQNPYEYEAYLALCKAYNIKPTR